MITNYNLGQEVEVRFIGKIKEVKLDEKNNPVYAVDGERGMLFARYVPGNCMFKLIEPEDVKES